MTEAKDIVTFRDILRSYPPGAEMVVNYQIEAGSEMKTTTRDWVGLFRVGWTSSRDYYTFEWAPQLSESGTRSGMVKFAGRRLPPEDGHFYQLCYVSRDGTVRGASAPFQFAPLSVSVEDMELVEVTDESMTSVMVLQKKSKEMESLRRESAEARTELSTLQRTLAQVKTENETLTQQGEELRKEVEASREAKEKEVEGLRGELEQVRGAMEGVRGELEGTRREVEEVKGELKQVRGEMEGVRGELEGTRGQLEERNARALELERQVQTLRDSEQKLIEKLDHEKGLNRELASAKEGEEHQLEQYKKRVSDVEGEVVVLTSENEDLKEQVRIKEAQVDDLQQLAGARGEELEQLVAQLEASEQANAEMNATCAELRVSLEQTFAEVTSLQQRLSEQGSLHANVDALLTEKDETIKRLEQELMVAQANISELMGAQGTSVECPQQAPPPPPGNTVDRGAYDALQQAYETMEGYYKEEQQQKERVAKQLKIIQETSKAQYEEMAQRVLECQKQYKLKAQECVELQRRLKKGGLPTTVEVPQDGSPDLLEKVKELERAQEQMVQDCQAAAQELSMRGQESRAQKERIEELEAELAQLQRKYDELEDHHDMKIAEKNDEFQRQKLVFDAKMTELAEALNAKGELEAQLAQLKGQVQGIRQNRGAPEDRNCPVCGLKFPSRMYQQDFEKHVQGHFPS